MLLRRAERDADRDGFVFLRYRRQDVAEEERLSYRDLVRRAQAIAATLQTRCAYGDRILILCPEGLDYIASFFGCQLAGMVAVPAYPPRNAKHWGPLRTILQDAQATAILVPQDLVQRLTAWSGEPLPPLFAIDSIDSVAAADWRDPNTQPDDLAFLQYTSGSTGD